MMDEIQLAANPMIGEASLPDLLIAADNASEFVRIRAFDQLNRAFDGYVVRRSQEQMSMFRHDNKRVQFITPFATIPIERFQEDPYIYLDRQQFSAMKRRESDEISSRRGDESSRLQKQISAAESRMSFRSVNWHEWNSCPSRWFFL